MQFVQEPLSAVLRAGLVFASTPGWSEMADIASEAAARRTAHHGHENAMFVLCAENLDLVFPDARLLS